MCQHGSKWIRTGTGWVRNNFLVSSKHKKSLENLTGIFLDKNFTFGENF